MIDSDKRNKVAIELVRLGNFLGNNQLVQANAVVQKVEAMVAEEVVRSGGKAENHPWWLLVRKIHLVKDWILKGRTEQAVVEAARVQATWRDQENDKEPQE